jgi:indolepyruvate ferredoxin oxidoreductase alpha subunit
MICIETFECPALVYSDDEGRVEIDRMICSNCGVCIPVCPVGAIVAKAE